MYVLSKHIENIKKILKKFSIFTAEKILCILHVRVFVMQVNSSFLKDGHYLPKVRTSQKTIEVLSNVYFFGFSSTEPKPFRELLIRSLTFLLYLVKQKKRRSNRLYFFNSVYFFCVLCAFLVTIILLCPLSS